MRHHYLLLLQQWLSFICQCHDSQVLNLLARHCNDAHCTELCDDQLSCQKLSILF